MRFDHDKLWSAWYHCREATDNLRTADAFALCDHSAAADGRCREAVRYLAGVAAALGYSFEPLPVTDKPGFDGRDDRSLGMKEADVT